MKEIPITLVKGNQTMLVLLTLTSIIFQNVWIVALAFALIAVSLVFGAKANVAFKITKAIIKKDYSKDETEAVELTRFNQTIAATLLGIALIMLLSTNHWIGWMFVSMVTLAASVALMGFCVGCFLYFQLKQFRYKLKTK